MLSSNASRVVLGPKDRVTPSDLRNVTHVADAVLFAYYHGRLRKKNFRLENFFRDFFRKFFFRSFMAKMVSNCAIFDTESLAISDSLKSTLGGAIMEKN